MNRISNDPNIIFAAFGKPQAVLSKEALAEKLADKAGDSIELSSRGKNSSGGLKSSRDYVSLVACLFQSIT